MTADTAAQNVAGREVAASEVFADADADPPRLGRPS